MDINQDTLKDLWIKRDHVNGNVYFRFESSRALKQSEAVELQKLKGYHPNGYGFGGFKVENWKRFGIVTSWSCSDSCR